MLSTKLNINKKHNGIGRPGGNLGPRDLNGKRSPN